jgi:hypothetical protein
MAVLTVGACFAVTRVRRLRTVVPDHPLRHHRGSGDNQSCWAYWDDCA